MIWRQTTPTATIEVYGASDIGRVRSVNADTFLASPVGQLLTSQPGHSPAAEFPLAEAHLLAIADGIGQERGLAASGAAIEAVRLFLGRRQHQFAPLAERGLVDPLDLMKAAVRHAQERVRREAARGNHSSDLGTTLTLACVVWPRLYLAHAGDSRCYLFRDGRLLQLTTDHTFAQRLVDAGILDPQQATSSQWRHVLWNVVGGGTDDLLIDDCETLLIPGDRLLLCSDGLSGTVPESQIARLLGETEAPEDCCRHLIDAANAVGGTDNITAVVASLSR